MIAFRSHFKIFNHCELFRTFHAFSSNVSIQQNSFALSKPSHSYPYAAASQALPVSSRQPFQLFQRVSWILLLNDHIYRMSSITRRYDMLATCITIAFTNRFTGQCRRAHGDKSRLRFRRKMLQIESNYPPFLSRIR